MSIKQHIIDWLFGTAKIYTVNNNDESLVPKRAHIGDAGIDLYILEDVVIQPGETAYCRAGVRLELSSRLCGHVMTRSSTQYRTGLTVTPTLIDCNYKDEISTIVSNYQQEPITLKRGDRVAQLILLPYTIFSNESMPAINQRAGKFGSSDKVMNKGDDL